MKTDDPKKLMDKIKKDFYKFAENDDMWDEIGNKLVTTIRGLTQEGKGTTKNFTKPVPFKDLATSTKRKRKKEKPKLDSATSPDKSNLRFTGRMFRELTHRVAKGQVTIEFESERSAEIASYHHKNTRIPERPFMFVSMAQFRILQAILQKYIDKFIKEI